jgi:thiamine-phosphate pyrophosphorylase
LNERFPPLCAILDVDTAIRHQLDPGRLARAFLVGGARWIQVRAKHLESGAFLALCDEVVAEAGAHGALVVINDRADLAALSRAGGVHVGQDDLTVDAARRLLGRDAAIGVSTHTMAQFAAALETTADYVAVGPVFRTQSKEKADEAVGLDFVRRAAGQARGRPVVAIGGMTLDRSIDVMAAGATAVAVIGDLLEGDPERRVGMFVERLRHARRPGRPFG